MVRQEDLQLRPDPAGNLVVRDRQFLGREYRYTLTTATNDILYARTATRDRLEVGQTVTAQVDLNQPQMFAMS